MSNIEDYQVDDADVVDEAFGPWADELVPEQQDRQAILIVDDEPNVVRAVHRLLKSQDADIVTAASGMEAIQVLRGNPRIGVIISDQFMPGMSGTELLEHVRLEHAHVVRVMLTGNNDLSTAVEAINRGDVFRFVLKPWKNNELSRIVEMALKQHQIEHDHRRYQEFIAQQNDRLKILNEELERRVQERTRALVSSREEIANLYEELQESFDSTIQVLLSSMELGDIKIVDHCRRTAARAQQLAREVGLSEGTIKPLVRAGLLHWIGLIGAPSTMFEKRVETFDVEEQAVWEFHTLLGQQVLQSVPALEFTGLIMLHYLRRYDDLDFRVGADIGFGTTLDEELLLSCRILHLSSFFERARTIELVRGKDQTELEEKSLKMGLEELKKGNGTRFDPNLVRTFNKLMEKQLREQSKERKLSSVAQLSAGMMLARPLETTQGIPIAPPDIIITPELLRRFHLFNNTGGLGDIWVYASLPG